MGMMQEFREFAVKGNVIDLAVGVIIGGAFGKIVTSFIDDMVMPVIGKVMGKTDFSQLYINMSDKTFDSLADAKKAGAAISYGAFVNNIINFAIMAFVIFMMVKMINKMKREAPAAPAAPAEPPKQEVLLMEIRDLLKSRS